MFKSITSAVSNFFKSPFGTSNSSASTSPNPFSQTSTSPSPMKPLGTVATSPFKAPVIANTKPLGPTFAPTTNTARPTPLAPTTSAIQNQVLSSPVTVGQLNQPNQSPVQQQIQSDFSSMGTAPSLYDTNAQAKQTTGRDDILKRIMDLSDSQGNQALRQQELEKEFDIQAKQEKLNQLNARAMTVDREYENKRRGIMENPEGKLTGALAGEIRNLDRQRDQQLADIGIQQAIAQGDVQLANSRVEARIKSEFEPLQQQVEGLKTYLSLYNDDLTSSEKVLLESQIRQQEDMLKGGMSGAMNSEMAQYYAQGIQNGSIQMSEVPQDARGSVLGFMQQSGIVDAKEVQRADKARLTLNSLVGVMADVAGGTTAVGSGLQRIVGRAAGFVGFGSFEEKNAKIKQIMAMLSLENVQQMRGLGAMSENEFRVVRESAAALTPNMSEKAFVEELGKIQTVLSETMLRSHAVPLEEKSDLLFNVVASKNPTWNIDKVEQEVKNLLPAYSPQTFNSAGNASASTLRNAIIKQESGGNYTAVNKDSGALGKYQIMPSNLQGLLGMANTAENRKKFLNSPQLQDKAFDNLLAELSRTHQGDIKKVLAAYYGGAGAAKVVGTSAGDRPQGGGKYPSINQYVAQVLSKIKTA